VRILPARGALKIHFFLGAPGQQCTRRDHGPVGHDRASTYGANYPGTNFDYGQASQFAQSLACGGPFGPDSTYCDTVLKPTP